MKTEEIDLHCDRFESRLNAGEDISVEQFLDENRLLRDKQLLARLRRVHDQYKSPIDQLDMTNSLPDERRDEPLATTQEFAESKSGTQIGSYKLLQRIGEGGMGTVYMAEQQEPVRRKVALKIIKPGMDSRQVVARFEAERQALAMMDHQNIAKVLDAGTTERGLPFFVMELVKGIPITEYCDENRLTVDERLQLFVPLCQAIQHAHQKGIIHRDIKPSNVLVCNFDGRPVPKVIDFGVAKAVEQRLTDKTMFTEFGQVIGTLQYMSPEQAGLSQLDVDTRSDIYSLGVLLYELLTGSTPLTKIRLQQAGRDEMMRLIREEEPQRPSTRLSGSGDALPSISAQRRAEPRKLGALIRGDLDWIVMKSLEKDRTRRYETAVSLAHDIQRYLSDDLVEARPPSTWYRLSRTARKNRGAFLTATSFMLLLILAIAGISWQLWRAEDALEVAEVQTRNAMVSEEKASSARAEAESRLDEAEELLYASNIQLASSRLSTSQFNGVRELLDQSPRRWRNWEFRHLIASSDESLLTLEGHEAGIADLAFSPSGKRLATASRDGSARIWDASSGAAVATLIGHKDQLTCVGWSPDESRVVTSSMDNTARVWSVQKSSEIVRLEGHQDFVYGCSYSPDGRSIATGSREAIHIWNAVDGALVQSLRPGGAPVFSPDGTRLIATPPYSGPARVWNLASGKEDFQLPRKKSQYRDACFSPDATRILTCCADGISIWNQFGSKELVTIDSPIRMNRAKYSPDGEHVVTSNRQFVTVWDATDGGKRFSLNGPIARTMPVAYHPQGRVLATGSEDGIARIWDVSGNQHSYEFGSNLGYLTSVDFNSDGTQLVTTSREPYAVVWDVPARKQILKLQGHEAAVVGAAFSADGSKLVTASEDKTAILWDAITGRRLLTCQPHAGVVKSAAISPDGTRIVTGCSDHTASLWNATTGKLLRSFVGHTQEVQCVKFSPDGTRVITTSADFILFGRDTDATVRVWDAQTGEPVKVLNGHTADVQSASFDPSGERIVTASSDGTARVWNASTGETLFVLKGHNDYLSAALFNPDATRIITSSYDMSVRVWDADQGRELMKLDGAGANADISPDGKCLVSGTANGTIRVWTDGTTVTDEALSSGLDLSRPRSEFVSSSASIETLLQAIDVPEPEVSLEQLRAQWHEAVNVKATDDESGASALLSAALAHLRLGRHQQVKEMLDPLIESWPKPHRLYLYRAIAHAGLGQIDAAHDDLEEFESIDGSEGWPEVGRSAVMGWSGNFSDAEKVIRSMTAESADQNTWYNSARAWSLLYEAALFKDQPAEAYAQNAIESFRQLLDRGFDRQGLPIVHSDLDRLRTHREFLWLVWNHDEQSVEWNSRLDFRRRSNAAIELVHRREFDLLSSSDERKSLVERLLRAELSSATSDSLANRCALAMAGLVRLKVADDLSSIIEAASNPNMLAYLVREVVRLQVPPTTLIEHIRETDSALTKALLLQSLQQQSMEGVSFDIKSDLVDELKAMIGTPNIDPHLRSTALSFLQRLQVKIPAFEEQFGDELDPALGERSWYQAANGHTMLMLSPFTPSPLETENATSIRQYVFAIADRETTIEQFGRFQQLQATAAGGSLPVTNVTRNQVARYCNWLSEQAGIPEDQWCYAFDVSDVDGDNESSSGKASLKAGFLDLDGYRLPTSADWRYACGETVANPLRVELPAILKTKYAWVNSNSARSLHPVGQLLPNRHGLFDSFGNAEEWGERNPPAPSDTSEENESRCNLNGGSYWLPENYLHSDYYRVEESAEFASPALGFRICRSIKSGETRPSQTAFWTQSMERIDGEQMKLAFKNRRELGLPFFRPSHLEMEVVDGELLYSVTFSRSYTPWRANWKMSEDTFTERNRTYLQEGYVLDQHRKVEVDGETIHAALWLK